jgi:predicted HTH transcriptional regulator
MTKEKFEILISKNESSTLDFKKELYKFEKGNDDQLAKFVKDIISFSNTIRESPAYILIGIEEDKGKKLHHGIEEFVDDAILQDKIKDKVDPKPKFSYFTYNYNDLIYGIIEIPVKRYAKPIMPTKNLRGLESGKIYFRRGSSNSEASHLEAIEINNWITKINTPESIDNIKKRLIELISEVNSSQFISPFLADSMQIGKEINNVELYGFCKNELLGWTKGDKSIDSEHRTLSCLVSFDKIKSINHQIGTPISVVWAEL